MLEHVFIVLIIYSLYVQLSPTMGNIWIRSNSEGERVFCPMSLVDLILAPLQTDKTYFWEPNFWPINFCVYIIVYFFIYLLYNHTLFLDRDEISREFRLQWRTEGSE